VEVPPLLQLSIALFTGIVAATVVPSVRSAIPLPVEILLWVAFVTVCLLGVASITDPNARELNSSAVWGAEQIINTAAGLMLGGAESWMSDHRFAIASWLVIIAGADIFRLILIGSLRSGQEWQPRVRLGEWMEMPTPAPKAVLARRQHAAADPLAGANRRIATWSAIATTAALAKMVDLSLWFRDVMVLPRLHSLRHEVAHLQFAARSWYTAAGEPVINGLASRIARAIRRTLEPVALKTGEVVDIQALLSAQSIGWYGPMTAGPPTSSGEHDAAAPQRSDRLAS